MRRWRKRLLLGIGALAVLVISLVVGAVLVLRSQWFYEQARARIIREIENATGGRVELGSFEVHWLNAEARGLVVHGLEPAGAPPLLSAARVAVGLKIISAFRRKVDIESLDVDSPRVSVIVDANGRTNIPAPRRESSKSPLEQFLNLAVGRYRVSQGEIRYVSSKTPLDLEGEGLETELFYEAAGGAYSGRMHTEAMRVSRPLATPAQTSVDAEFRFDKGHVEIKRSKFATKQSSLSASGTVEQLENPVVKLSFNGEVTVAEGAAWLRIPVEHRGTVRFRGAAEWHDGRWHSEGTMEALGLAYRQEGVILTGVSVAGPYRIDPDSLVLEHLRARALDGEFAGSISLEKWSRFAVRGNVDGFALEKLNEARSGSPLAWSSTVSGSLDVAGSFARGRKTEIKAAMDVTLEPRPGKIPLAGAVGLDYDSNAGRIAFRDSHLELPASRLQFSGELSQQIQLVVASSNLNDFLPALALASPDAPKQLPVRLVQGTAQFTGVVRGDLQDSVVSGRAAAGPLEFEGRVIRNAEARVEASSRRLRLTAARVEAEIGSASGDLTLGLENWKPVTTSELSVHATFGDTAVAPLLKEAKADLPVQGRVTGSATVEGTYGEPRGSAHVLARQVQAWGETFDQLEADVRYQPRELAVSNVRGRAGTAMLEFSGAYRPTSAGWRQGEVRFQGSGRNWHLKQVAAVRERQPNVDGLLNWSATGVARVDAKGVELSSFGGDLRVDQATVEGRTLGTLSAKATTNGQLMTVSMTGDVHGSRLQGDAEWSLGGNSFGLGELQVTNVTLQALQDVGLLGDPNKSLPFRGVADAVVGFAGPILQPNNWKAAAKITRFELEPVWSGATAPPGVERWTIRNKEPLVLDADATAVHIQSAQLVGEGTDLEASGTFSFRARNPWNLNIKGSVSLPMMSKLEPDLLAEGSAALDATIRGSIAQPQVNGHLELKEASFSMRGIPNGIEKATGVITFDRTRATFEKFSAQTGGGDLALSGYVGFGGDVPVYHLRATAGHVRVRYPDEVSTTFDSSLELSGTSSRSQLSGTVTVTKMGITPKTDLGSLLFRTGKATSTPPPDEFLRNMQLDVQVETSANAEFQTSLARNIEPEASLRLGGTLARPVLLGHVSVNEGEIQFFGNKYTITRGDINFFNPVKIEPAVNLDLETKVRGIVVTINLAGTIGKMTMNYRSDPPLQSQEILMLLAAGRTPESTQAPTTGTQNQSLLQSGGNSLLGQVVTTPISGRLQRLFGVSRLKIDPDLTSVTNSVQARLTVEQQISQDVTVTYITNLNRAQQQIVTLRWDFSKDFSVIATRDENGIFGVDFQYRRRFNKLK